MRPRLDGWAVSDHALKRALQRRVHPEEITAAIQQPHICRPGHDPGTEYRERDGVAVVVNVAAHRIVTVLVTDPETP
jgi:hypothetical protein